MDTSICNISYAVVLAILACSCSTGSDYSSASQGDIISSQDVKGVAGHVFNWQMNHHPKAAWNAGWMNAVLYIGITEAGKAFGDERYWQAAIDWAEFNNWKIGKRQIHADDQASAQVYLELYRRYRKEHMIADARKATESLLAINLRGRELWYWCDALFMSPPVLAKLSTTTGKAGYFWFLNNKFWDVYAYLYDPHEYLFFRDKQYFGVLDQNGNKVFWSRGNGWVLAGLVAILRELPESNERYNDYLNLYRKMISKIVYLQGNDGLWRTNLLSPDIYPNPETSGSGFYCYAIAWGINSGVLREEKYNAALNKGWEGLTSRITADGKLGWAQGVAQRPGPVSKDNSEIYATGAFLMAASEMYKLARVRNK